jgi:hypothetical protein
VAFGFSSIVLNHDIKLEKDLISHQWDTVSSTNFNDKDNTDIAESVKNEMRLMGWTPYWLFNRDSLSFQFTVTHPGRNYRINLDLVDGRVKVAEIPKGFLAVLNSIHFLNGNIPNAPIVLRSWAVYQWLALLTMLVSLFLGLWLWIKFHYQSWEGLVFGSLFVVTMVLMLLI